MPATFYLAGRVAGEDVKSVMENLSTELEERGHTCLYKWWNPGVSVALPYLKNADKNASSAKKMLTAAMESDVFVLLAHPEILGGAIEFGAALASMSAKPDKRIYVIGARTARESIFYTLPVVKNPDSVREIRQEDWY